MIAMIYEDDFSEGFRQGLCAICGKTVAMPALWPADETLLDRTPFQTGIMRGIEYGTMLRGAGQTKGDSESHAKEVSLSRLRPTAFAAQNSNAFSDDAASVCEMRH